jgi:hypothetical protein
MARISTAGLTAADRPLAASVLAMPRVSRSERSCLFRLLSSKRSPSATMIVPTPMRTRDSRRCPPRPPKPANPAREESSRS